MSNYQSIQTIRYMGNKAKLLNSIIPEIEAVTNCGDTVCDIMAGTNAIGYALKNRNRIIANDIQYYSYVVSRCLLDNYSIPSLEEAHADLDDAYCWNNKNNKYSFFVDNYTDTYFSEPQCRDIDSLRYAVDQVQDEHKVYFYLTLLMSAMCKAQSTPGHFAQFMSKDNKRIVPLRALSVSSLLFDKIADFQTFSLSAYNNSEYCLDYKELFKLSAMDEVACFYLDSPYTTDQYSRFYHVLETVCKYDKPDLKYKAKYRTDRIRSAFCYKKSVESEFENVISFCASKGAPLLISYSNHGVISVENLMAIAKKHYKHVALKYVDFDHSSQGKGLIHIKEVIISLLQ